jgi:hypothetical protein
VFSLSCLLFGLLIGLVLLVLPRQHSCPNGATQMRWWGWVIGA